MKRSIDSVDKMNLWQSSQGYDDLVCFIIGSSGKLKHLNMSDLHIQNEGLLELLEKLESWLDRFPALHNVSCRYGNIAFRDWYNHIRKESDELISTLIKMCSIKKQGDTIRVEEVLKSELIAYFIDSFGSEARLDYGTGHELNFAIFLMILFKVGFLDLNDHAATTILIVFERYLKLIRRIQIQYNLEPAGSHGSWSLDDHQFLCFLWGSAQMADDGSDMEPSNFPDKSFHERSANDKMFMSAIAHITKVKSGPFFEHSNQLWQISGVHSWSKIHQGLVKMYRCEVLGKFPVVQHLLFGKYFSFEPCPRLQKK